MKQIQIVGTTELSIDEISFMFPIGAGFVVEKQQLNCAS